jgi:WD40 repeat protein
MRLLERNNGDEFILTKDFVGDDEIPPYAILSHTWTDGHEVTFSDLQHGTGKVKKGYEKIRFCGKQAELDGLRYFWVDTCCIDKSNQVELQDAINSMFRWYQNAIRCYVYLSDVSVTKRKASNGSSEFTWEPNFRASKWFTRGWTLQELLAPPSVKFFSVEGKPLGDKGSLERQISEITDIPTPALRGAPLYEFSVEERLSWTNNRHTTRKEDRAYSLLGVFGIFMLLNYGEGEQNAFKRLRKKLEKPETLLQQYDSVQSKKEDRECIKDLRLTDPHDDKKRIEGTKGGLLKDSCRWVFANPNFQKWRDEPQSRLLWIKGDPGKGKTMLLCGIADELKRSMAKTDLLSYFFCQATDSRINNATAALRGLLYMLVDQQPSIIIHVRRKYDRAGKALFEDANAWVALSEIFTNMLKDPNINMTYFIIDALDECVPSDLPILLDFIVQKSAVSSRVKWIVSSRNWPNIEEKLERVRHKVRLSLEINAQSISAAVSVFVQHKVRQLAEQKQYSDKTQKALLDHLSSNAHNTFLWVALVCQNLENVSKWNVIKKLNAFPPGLDSLYARMMQQISDSDDADRCKQILALAAIVYRPITIKELVTLAEQLEDVADDPESVRGIIGRCGSFLTLRENIIYFVHQSAKDFLSRKASQNIFPFEREKVHWTIFSRSLQAMFSTLHRDMYDLRELDYLAEQIQQPYPDPLEALQYPCIYWVDHLCASVISSMASGVASLPDVDRLCNFYPTSASCTVNLEDGGAVEMFLKKKYLYWLEALSLCKSISKGVVSIAKLESLIKGRVNVVVLTRLVHDAHRFITSHKRAIENSPLQVYVSALLFSPEGSLIRRLAKQEEPKWVTIKPNTRGGWSPCIQTLYDHSDIVRSVVFSHNSTRLASASNDTTVKIWDATSGECLQTLEGHSDTVRSVVFSHDSTLLASASDDETVKIWDATSGECLQTLEGHNGSINSVAFSHDSTWLASASDDTTVKIWDTTSGECLQTLEDHSNIVTSVAFSHDSIRLVSVSFDITIKIWDTTTSKCLQTLEGHSELIRSVVFSHDSTLLASASDDETVKIWDATSGECLQTLEGHNDSINSVAFSHDSTRLALALDDRTVKVWDVSHGLCLQTLRGHTYGVISVAFSHDSTRLISASNDRTIKIWDANSSGCVHTVNGHNDYVTSIVFSQDSTRLASASNDTTVKIWDVTSGKCLQTLAGHSDIVRSVVFSHDSTLLVSASDDETVKIWDATSGECLQTLEGHSDTVRSVVFSHDSTLLASASDDETVKIWDATSGECLQTLAGHSDAIRLVTFSQNSILLASASDDETVKIWDTTSGELLQTLSIGQTLCRISFDISNLYLHTNIGTIGINALSGTKILLTESEPQGPQRLDLSTDGAWITYNSEKLVWIPSEYRSSCSTVSGKRIGVGVGSGRVWICQVQFNPS